MAHSQDSLPDTQPNTDSLCDGFSQFMESQSVEVAYGRLFIRKTIMKTLGIGGTVQSYVQPNVATESYDIIKPLYQVGRDAKTCDFVVDSRNMTTKLLDRISKTHFKIERLCETQPVILTDLSVNGTFVNNELVGKFKKRVLVDGDIIALAHARNSLFAYQYLGANNNIGIPDELGKKYFVSKKIGSGACGVVSLVYSIRDCGQFAMKQVPKLRNLPKKSPMQDPARIMNEVNIMKSLQHPCIVQMIDIVDTPNDLFMVLELMNGGDLLNRILKEKKHYLPEDICKHFFLQICHAVKYMHDHQVTHRDLKPDNILLSTKDPYCLLKVSDFGLSKIVDSEESMMKTMCGTKLYVAPEVLTSMSGTNNVYTNKVDVWSMGVVLYTMLSGSVPFSDDYGTSAAKQIMEGKFQFRSVNWQKVSQAALALIKRMLNVNVKARPSVLEVMEDPWLQDYGIVSRVNALMKTEQQVRRKLVESKESIRILQEIVPHNPNHFRTPCAKQPPAKRQKIF